MTTNLIDLHLNAERAKGLSPLTIISREEILWRMQRELPHGLEQASTEEIQAWLGRDAWTVKTKETYWCHIVAFYRWCVRGRTQRLDWDPSEDIPRPRPPRGLPHPATDDQVRRALAELHRPMLLAVILAVGVGMRAAEIARAHRDDFTDQMVRIVGKGGKIRHVPMVDEVWQEVQGATGLLMTSAIGRRVSGNWVSNRCCAAFKKAGLGTTLHSFRHTYATRLRRAGVDTLVISKLIGHSSVATTEIYVEVDDADLRRAVSRLPALMGGALPAVTRQGPAISPHLPPQAA